MIDAIKKLDKKFLILVSCLLGLPILLIIFLAIIQGCSNKTISHEKYEEKMIEAYERYLEDENKLPKLEGEYASIKLDKLVELEYIKSPEELLKDSNCKGSVSVRRNGASVQITEGGYLNYIVNLECDEYKTVKLIDKLKENIVTEKSGLYVVNDGYIYKGDKINNFVSFDNNTYRIMSIDKDGIIKLIKSDYETTNKVWDKKFNVEVNRYSGKNIAEDSEMLITLQEDYNNPKKFSAEGRKHIVAYDSCVGKRSSVDFSIDKTKDCSAVLKNQLLSLISVSEFALASLDPDCKSLDSRSCINYNYLNDVIGTTWTLNTSSDNTYEVLYISSSVMYSDYANKTNPYNLVLHIDGNELYKGGEGTIENPYVIE